MLAKNQANDFILTDYILFPSRVTSEGSGGEDAHITWRDTNSKHLLSTKGPWEEREQGRRRGKG